MPSRRAVGVVSVVRVVQGEAERDWNESEELPKILFLVPPQDLTLVVNEVSNVMQLILPRLYILLCFYYRPRHNADIKLFGQLLIFVQIIVPLPAERDELRVFGHPICEMIFRKNCELGPVRRGGSYEFGGSGEVVEGFEGLGV